MKKIEGAVVYLYILFLAIIFEIKDYKIKKKHKRYINGSIK
jgi:hypothetical protein